MKTALIFILALTIFLPFSLAHAQTVLISEDFQGYLPGSGLAGQGGWYQSPVCTAPLYLSLNSPLGTIAVDGRMPTRLGYNERSLALVFHSLPGPLNANGLSVLSWDGYAFSANRSHSAGVFFANADLEISRGWGAYWYDTPRETPKWIFVSGAGNAIFMGGFDQKVHLETIIDGENGTIYGRLTHSGGVYETPHFPITPAVINGLTEISIYEDFRDWYYLGADFDNLVLTTTPSYTSPTITSLTASPDSLWPPNQKMALVTLNAVAEGGSGTLAWEIINVSSNELNIPGVDWAIVGPLQLNLRATRLGKESGRIYTITVQCTDERGNSDTKIVIVTVPHDQGKY